MFLNEFGEQALGKRTIKRLNERHEQGIASFNCERLIHLAEKPIADETIVAETEEPQANSGGNSKHGRFFQQSTGREPIDVQLRSVDEI